MKKIFNYSFFIFFALVIFFSFGQKVLAETCEGLQVDASGSDGTRCTQASQELRSFLSCLYTKNPSIVITSIGDDPSVYDDCVTGWTDPRCSHHQNSCHYGGAVTANGGRTCAGSHAVDLRSIGLSPEAKNALVQTARSCNDANAFLEMAGQANEHVHASVGSATCDCGEGRSGGTGIIETFSYQSQDICIDFNTPIPGLQEFLTEKCPYDDQKGAYLVTSKTIGLYINAVYRYGAGLAGVLAMFMIVFAAWQWIIAAGNSGKIENAKDTIISALIGLALLFGGYLLLSQISSRLVEMKSLDVTPIEIRQTNNVVVENICASINTDIECNQNPKCVFTDTCYSSDDNICTALASVKTCGSSYSDNGYTCAGGLMCGDGESCNYYPGGNHDVPSVPCSYMDIKNGKECACRVD